MNKLDSLALLKELAQFFEGTVNHTKDGGELHFDSPNGTGTIKSVMLFDGLEVMLFNMTLHTSLELNYKCTNNAYLHFLSIQEGMLQHRFLKDELTETALRFQNIIVGSVNDNPSIFHLPQKTKLKFGLISVFKNDDRKTVIESRGQLPLLLNEILKNFVKGHTYKYFGTISDRDAKYLKLLYEEGKNKLENRLRQEACVFHLLASKLRDHEENRKIESKKDDLSYTEITKILNLSEYISNNIEKPLKLQHLERESGLNQKRIQYGFQQFFGFSVNKYIANLRIIMAKELLEKTDLSISEIVFKIGLSSRSYFSRIFSEKYGILPKEYKKNHHLSNPTFELCYYSTEAKDLRTEDFKHILEAANRFNKEHNISGCLIYHNGHFMQLLEGPKEIIEDLYEHIKQDKRHRKIHLMFSGFKSGRIFKEWSMAFIEQPSVFSMHNLNDFKLLNVDILMMLDKNSKTKNDNVLQTKLMWENARNALLMQNEGTLTI
ncbi:BLUF domain-containing protein [Galbibacter sp. BG1]|uniref:BLUF domain-containing protein n=1 Tax=Galbibacter sp. BG1 TaxID=1170699 RepID=UPI0015BCBAED|nr:BLUF domain-containing protein [Galbibacter sp. BG1]QLE01967.1 BLUF domain-containing protein [Galbibacter sp. BG1]